MIYYTIMEQTEISGRNQLTGKLGNLQRMKSSRTPFLQVEKHEYKLAFNIISKVLITNSGRYKLA